MARCILLLMTIVACHNLVAQEQTYTPPQLFNGTLYLSTAPELTETQSSILQSELNRTNNSGWLIGIGTSEQAEQSSLWKQLKERKWVAEPRLIGNSDWNEATMAEFKQLKRGSCVWIDHRALAETADADRAQRAELLRACLDRNGLLILDATHVQSEQQLAEGWNLIPDIDVVRIKEQPLPITTLRPKRVRLQMASNCLLRIGRREVINLSDNSAPACHCQQPGTVSYPEPLQQSFASREVIDLTAARRALVERQQPAFPADTDYHPRLASGSLVIVGGGGAPAEIWDKFVELAGGKDSRIVVLPTAVAEPEYEDDDEARLLKQHGAGEVRMLRQYSRDDVSKPEYLEELRWATGIWFGGGRQWRFVDAYWGTPAWNELKQVLVRGGVIGGSSAGATIQGDLLVRGHPLGNQIMVADGYRRGLGLLDGVAIDQHFKQRNRFDDLAAVVKRYPKIYGIGIDESTALVVQSPGLCSVIGKGSVWLNWPTSETRQYVEHASGSEFTLPLKDLTKN